VLLERVFAQSERSVMFVRTGLRTCATSIAHTPRSWSEERLPTLCMLLRLARALEVAPERLVAETVARLPEQIRERNRGG
jgi:hypothetical protein